MEVVQQCGRGTHGQTAGPGDGTAAVCYCKDIKPGAGPGRVRGSRRAWHLPEPGRQRAHVWKGSVDSIDFAQI